MVRFVKYSIAPSERSVGMTANNCDKDIFSELKLLSCGYKIDDAKEI